jgi:hypothetical protein
MPLERAIHYDLLAQLTVAWKIPTTAGGTVIVFEQRSTTFNYHQWTELLRHVSDIAANTAAEWAAYTPPVRCPSCDHLPAMHQPDGCWYTITTGTPGESLNCPCTVPHGEHAR